MNAAITEILGMSILDHVGVVARRSLADMEVLLTDTRRLAPDYVLPAGRWGADGCELSKRLEFIVAELKGLVDDVRTVEQLKPKKVNKKRRKGRITSNSGV